MSTYTDLVATVPGPTAGVPLGVPAASGQYRFVVQISRPTYDGSVLGTFVLGTDVLSGLSWVDVTKDFRGATWNRGGNPDDRPETGELTLQLDNRSNDYSPRTRFTNGPGSLVRIGVSRVLAGVVVEWSAEITVVVESWEERSLGLRQDRFVEITGVEPATYGLAQINDNALPAPLYDFDTPTMRIDHLLAAADSRYAATISLAATPATFRFQATDLAANRLSEIYLVGDSLDADVYNTKNGGLAVVSKGSVTHPQRLAAIPSGTDAVYDPDSFRTANDDALLVYKLNLARAGGTVHTYTNDALGSRRNQAAVTGRSDLTTYADADLDFLASRILARGSFTYRPAALALDADHGTNVVKFLRAAEIGQLVAIDNEDVTFSNAVIARMAHSVEPLTTTHVHWTCEVEFGVSHLTEWSEP